MVVNRKIRIKILAMSFLWASVFLTCREKYTPTIVDVNPNYFVVEGLINTGADSTLFTLSRTFKLDKKAVASPEKGAIVQVESDAGATYVLPELVISGTYGRPPLNLDQTKKYRLRIRTKDNKEYLSDFVDSKISPPVEKITHDFKGNQFNIYVSSRDPLRKSQYYKYQYVETWAYTAGAVSYFKIENHKISRRNFPEDDVFHCWKSAPSTNITLGNSANNAEDRVEDVLVNSVAPTSFKIYLGYSILVKQTVLTKEGFDFWQGIEKNSENVGSIFDSQPSTLFSNIRSTTNPNEVVVGFVSAGTVTEKRLTLSTYQMMPDWRQKPELDSAQLCEPGGDKSGNRAFYITSAIGQSDIDKYLLIPDKPAYILIDEIPAPVPTAPPVGWFGTSYLQCADCRVQGGTNKKPLYWF